MQSFDLEDSYNLKALCINKYLVVIFHSQNLKLTQIGSTIYDIQCLVKEPYETTTT